MFGQKPDMAAGKDQDGSRFKITHLGVGDALVVAKWIKIAPFKIGSGDFFRLPDQLADLRSAPGCVERMFAAAI